MNAKAKNAAKIIRAARAAGWRVNISPTRLSEGRVPLFVQVALFKHSATAYGPARHIILTFRRRNRQIIVSAQATRIYSSGAGKNYRGLWNAHYILNNP